MKWSDRDFEPDGQPLVGIVWALAGEGAVIAVVALAWRLVRALAG